MDRLKAIEVFVAVAQMGGFSPAGAKLGLSGSSVSRHIGNLENELGVQLLHRTTRHLRLTPEGEVILEHCQKVVGHIDRMMADRHEIGSTPRGRLRITMPHFLATILMQSAAADFARRYPEVEIEYLLLDRVVNIVEEGFDLAIRVGRMADSSLVTRKLLDLQLGIIASPDYVARNGAPESPADLAGHNCIIDTAAPYADRWPMIDAAGNRAVQPVRGNVTVNSGGAARDLALAGAGFAHLPEYVFFDDVESGRLVTVLDTHTVDYGGIFLVFPPGRHRSAALQCFTEILVEHAKPVQRYRQARRAAAEIARQARPATR